MLVGQTHGVGKKVCWSVKTVGVCSYDGLYKQLGRQLRYVGRSYSWGR